jgi:hypothetical protein
MCNLFKIGFLSQKILLNAAHIPTKQYVLNISLEDRKNPSNRYNLEELVDIYFCTCRYCKAVKNNENF